MDIRDFDIPKDKRYGDAADTHYKYRKAPG
jgi:hypothetical protein